jgi:hypothetical protein
MLCQRVIGTFYCDEVGDHYYLSLDRSNLCYEGTWLYYLPLSAVLIVVWVVGMLTRHRSERLHPLIGVWLLLQVCRSCSGSSSRSSALEA